MYLEPLGYRVITAASGDQAIKAAATERFDLVLCDVGMPGRSGLEVLDLLYAAGYLGKVILMTGWDSERVKADRRAALSDGILGKPFVGTELVRAIDAVLTATRA